MSPKYAERAGDGNKQARKHSWSATEGARSPSPPSDVSKAALEPFTRNLFRDGKKASSLILELLCGKSPVPHGFPKQWLVSGGWGQALSSGAQ